MRNLLILPLFLISTLTYAQVGFNTGDTDFDADLNAINVSAKADLSAFKADLSATFGVTSRNIDYMVSIEMEPAEMYLALEIAAAVNKPVEDVVAKYEEHRDKGWGYIAQQMGIKPGSEAFHALKGKSKARKEKSARSTGNGNGNGKGNTKVEKSNKKVTRGN